MSQQAQPAPTAPPAPPAKSRKMLVVAVAALVILGGGAYWKFAPAPAAPVEAPPEPPAYVVLDPFVVNLADENASRFLRLTVGIVVDGEEHATEFGEDAVTRMRVRSAILELLAQQHSDVLITPDGKTTLKGRIAELVSSNADHLKVSDVLFSEFIVQ